MFGPITSHCWDEEESRRVGELQAGSEEAFNCLIAQYAPPFYRLAYRLLRNPADAPDAVQEVFLKIFRNIEQFEGNCSLKTWLYRIAVNTIANQNRWWRRHREQELSLDSQAGGSTAESLLATGGGGNPFESALSRETQEMVWKTLLQLSPPHRTVLVLREMEGLSYEEVAEVLHVSLGTVKSRLARARRSLKHELEWMREPAPRGAPVWSPVE